jgi:two-component system, NarL family, response regulator DesR
VDTSTDPDRGHDIRHDEVVTRPTTAARRRARICSHDQALVRGALAALLALESDLEIVAQVDRGDRVLEEVVRTRPDVALLDIEMPGQDGLSTAAELAAAAPACRVLIVTTFGRSGYLRRALAAGASGFLLRDAPATELAAAIRRVAAGERVVDPGLAAAALSEGDSPLTARERDVLTAARSQPTVADIAAALFLSPGTVRNYLSSAMQKLGATTRGEAVRIADDRGWL